MQAFLLILDLFLALFFSLNLPSPFSITLSALFSKPYILPDTWGNSKNRGISEFEVSLCQIDDNLIIKCSKRESDCLKHYDRYTDNLRYLPCIDAIMSQFAEMRVSNKLGLILAGMEQDGAKGLTAIGRNKGKIAIQNPHEYEEERSRSFGNIIGSKDMPKAAILEANKHSINYDLISLYGKEDFKSLTDWLYESVS